MGGFITLGQLGGAVDPLVITDDLLLCPSHEEGPCIGVPVMIAARGPQIAGQIVKQAGWALFRPGGLLNSNRYLRIGIGRFGGEKWFRISGSLVGRFRENPRINIKYLGPWGQEMIELTAFQKKCERKLVESLADLGLTLTNRRLVGETEFFIEAEVGNLRVWIYVDEACVIGNGAERVFEKWDFDTPDALIEAFVDRVMSLLRQ